MTSLRFYKDHKLICWFPQGKVGEEIIKRFYRALHECVWADTAKRFCDFSKVTSFTVDANTLYLMSEFRKQYLASHKDITLVMHSTEPLGYGMSRMYEGLMYGWGIDIHVMRSITEAANVLSVDLDLLTDN